MNRPDVFQQLIQAAEAQGWTVILTRKCHLHFITPTGVSVFGPGTTSDNRSIHRVRAKLRRAGLKI